jgi:hypothetical protein
MTRTRQKLDEARFFLAKLDEHYFDHVRGIVGDDNPPPIFAYYLSAFLSAARSVTWVMRHEYIRVNGWEAWFQGQEVSEQHRMLLKLFNDLRVRSNKVEPLPLGHSIRLLGDEGAPERDPRLPRIQMTISTVDEEEKVLLTGEVAAMMWTLDEFEGEDLFPPCKQYLDLLCALVDDCESRFNAV